MKPHETLRRLLSAAGITQSALAMRIADAHGLGLTSTLTILSRLLSGKVGHSVYWLWAAEILGVTLEDIGGADWAERQRAHAKLSGRRP
jgi:transcriptional regulator with XRE-family HTH domain